MSSTAHEAIDAVWRIESAKLIAALTRFVRDVGLAEDLAHEALVAALEQWPTDGIPDNPGAWLMAAAILSAACAASSLRFARACGSSATSPRRRRGRAEARKRRPSASGSRRVPDRPAALQLTTSHGARGFDRAERPDSTPEGS